MRFSAIVNVADEPVLLAVLGHEADAVVEDARARSRRRARSPSSVIEPVTRVLQADERLGELGLAVALHAGDGEDLAGAHVEADVVDDDLAVGVDDA